MRGNVVFGLCALAFVVGLICVACLDAEQPRTPVRSAVFGCSGEYRTPLRSGCSGRERAARGCSGAKAPKGCSG